MAKEKVIFNGSPINPCSGDVNLLTYGGEYEVVRKTNMGGYVCAYELKGIEGQFSSLLFSNVEYVALAYEEPRTNEPINIQLVEMGAGNEFKTITPIGLVQPLGINLFKIYTMDAVYLIKVRR